MTKSRKKPQKRTRPAAKPRTPAKRRRSRKKTPSFWVTLLKMAGAVAILVTVVVTIGVVAHLTIDRKAPPAKPAVTAKRPPVVYEIYPKPKPKTVPRPVSPRTRTPASPPPSPQKTAKQVAPSKPAAKLPKVAIVIDDIGYDRRLAEAFMDFRVPLTFSILPHGPFSQAITRKLREKDYEIMLHLPMEPLEYPDVDPGPGALLDSMSPDELIVQLNRNIDSIPGIKGVNNHMGSRLTSASPRMYQIFTVLKKRRLYFIDSRSSADTVARPSAKLFQVPFAERDVFLDHLQEPDFIRRQFRELAKIAQEQGEAIGIAHPHDLTVTLFKEELPKLRKRVRLVPASEVVHIER